LEIGRFLVLVKPDIDLVARMLIEQHGADVRALVAMKADELNDMGNIDSISFWRRIMDAVNKQLSEPSSRTLH